MNRRDKIMRSLGDQERYNVSGNTFAVRVISNWEFHVTINTIAGYGNTDMNYDMGDTIPHKTVKKTALEVTMKYNMKVSEQCRIAALDDNLIIGLIRKKIA